MPWMELSGVATYRGARAEATSKREEKANILLVMICLVWFEELMIECEDAELIDAKNTGGRKSPRSNILLFCRLCHKLIQDRYVVGISRDISRNLRMRP